MIAKYAEGQARYPERSALSSVMRWAGRLFLAGAVFVEHTDVWDGEYYTNQIYSTQVDIFLNNFFDKLWSKHFVF